MIQSDVGNHALLSGHKYQIVKLKEKERLWIWKAAAFIVMSSCKLCVMFIEEVNDVKDGASRQLPDLLIQKLLWHAATTGATSPQPMLPRLPLIGCNKFYLGVGLSVLRFHYSFCLSQYFNQQRFRLLNLELYNFCCNIFCLRFPVQYNWQDH